MAYKKLKTTLKIYSTIVVSSKLTFYFELIKVFLFPNDLKRKNMQTTTEKKPNRIAAGPVRFSYANVFQTKLNDQNGKHEYSVDVLIPKKDKALVEKFKEGMKAAVQIGKEKRSEWNGKIPAGLKYPMKDGDDKRNKDGEKINDPVYAGMYYIKARTTNKPTVWDADNNVIMDESEFYSGCWGLVSIEFFPYGPVKGNSGISASLGHIKKTKEGEKLSGGATAEQDFGGLDVNNKKEDLEDDNDLLGDDLPF